MFFSRRVEGACDDTPLLRSLREWRRIGCAGGAGDVDCEVVLRNIYPSYRHAMEAIREASRGGGAACTFYLDRTFAGAVRFGGRGHLPLDGVMAARTRLSGVLRRRLSLSEAAASGRPAEARRAAARLAEMRHALHGVWGFWAPR